MFKRCGCMESVSVILKKTLCRLVGAPRYSVLSMWNTLRSASINLTLLGAGIDHQRSTASQAILSMARQLGSTQPLKNPASGPTDSHSSRQIGCRESGWTNQRSASAHSAPADSTEYMVDKLSSDHQLSSSRYATYRLLAR